MIPFIVVMAVVWAAAKQTDPGGSYSATSSAVRGGARAGGRSARETWDRRRPDRHKKRKARRDRWVRSGLLGWVAVGVERLAVGTGRLVWDGGAAAVNAVRDGGRTAREEWRTAWADHHPAPVEPGPEDGPRTGPDQPADHPAPAPELDPTGGRLPVREPEPGPAWWEPTAQPAPDAVPVPEPAPELEPVLVGAGAPVVEDRAAPEPLAVPASWPTHSVPAGEPTRGDVPAPRPPEPVADAPTDPEPLVSAPETPGEAPASTASPFTHGGPPGMTTATGTDAPTNDLLGVMKWCEDARAEVEGGTTGALVGQASNLYEGFDGAIARIEGKVGEAATAVQEAAAKLKEDLEAFLALVDALREVSDEARGG